MEAELTEYRLEDALIKRVLLETARHVIVLADSSKFGRVTFAHVGVITDIDTLITDFRAPADDLQRLRALGAEVIVVEY